MDLIYWIELISQCFIAFSDGQVQHTFCFSWPTRKISMRMRAIRSVPIRTDEDCVLNIVRMGIIRPVQRCIDPTGYQRRSVDPAESLKRLTTTTVCRRANAFFHCLVHRTKNTHSRQANLMVLAEKPFNNNNIRFLTSQGWWIEHLLIAQTRKRGFLPLVADLALIIDNLSN